MAAYQFYANVETLSFDNPKTAVMYMNYYVKENTDKKIMNLMHSHWLNMAMSMVMVNGAAFKGLWQHAFDLIIKKNTTFYSYLMCDQQSVTVDMMHKYGKFNYGRIPTLQATAVELPYMDTNMSMIVLLPNNCSEFGALEAAVTNETFLFSSLSKHMRPQLVDVYLPKFRIEYENENMRNYYEKVYLYPS